MKLQPFKGHGICTNLDGMFVLLKMGMGMGMGMGIITKTKTKTLTNDKRQTTNDK
jgi:hypothetical protein